MPYKSDKQERLMRAVAHSPSFAKKVGISQSVGQKFEAHKAEGGTVKDSAMKKIFAGKETPAEERKEKAAAKKAGMSYKAAERKFEGEKYCGGGKVKRYADGGETEAEMIPGAAKPDSPEPTFAEAFRTARARGDKTFMWKGEKKSTELASDKKPAAKPAAAAVSAAERYAASAKKPTYETVIDRTYRKNREEAAASAAAEKEAGAMARRRPAPIPSKISMEGVNPKTLLPYAKGGRVNPGLTPDMPDSEDQLRDARKAKSVPPRRVNPGLTPDLADSKEQERGYKKGGSVRGVGAAKRGYGCTGRK